MLVAGATVGGDFRVERELARGGMGGVWVVEQISTGQRRALKVMHPTLVAEPRMRERFEQEARIGGQVPSEHVVEVIAAGVDPRMGIPWLAMELLQGEDLGALAQRCGPMPFSELLPVFRQLCHALGAAHSVGIVHRDIKPENVFLAEVHSATASRQVKVLDFGIAKLAAEAKDSGTGQVGTPLWMAPEQSDPRAAITPAVDVWALGLLAFRLLTGSHYWRTANDPSANLSALFRETLMEAMAPASDRAREYGMQQALPTGFDAWFARAVARDPLQRFSDASAAFNALDGLASGSFVSAPPPAAVSATQSVVTGAGPRRSSMLPIVIGVVALVAVGAVVVVAAGAGLFFYGAGADAPAVASAVPPPAATPEPPTAPALPRLDVALEPVAVGTRPRSATAAAADPVPATPTPAPAGPAESPQPQATATSAGGELKPIDKVAVQNKVNAVAATAAAACAKLKAVGAASESYSGSCGFRPDGSTAGGMSGDGGARECVQTRMLSITIGKYAHPQEWHVEVFPWSVTVK